MSDNWHYLPEQDQQVAPSALVLPRSRGLLEAIEQRRNLKLVWCARLERAGATLLETIVADFACDGVPSRNSIGIEIPERIAMRLYADNKWAIEARALRKGFPLLLHQNAVEPDAPPSLCLYAEPLAAVNRTWTPERFLSRIENWLARSATETLHLDSQPVEQLFFASDSEIVLPHDFEKRRKEVNGKAAWASVSEKRTDGGCTYTLHWPSTQPSTGTKLIDIVYVELAPVVHGRPEEELTNLGQLQGVFASRGVDFGKALGESIHASIPPTQGRKKNQQDSHTLILLDVPVARTLGGEVERRFRRAFVVEKGFLDLGEALNVLLQHKGTYYQEQTGMLQPTPSTAWHAIAVEGIDVIPAMSRELAQVQSGFDDSGPIAVLVGAGSLGATMLEAWLRFGWGTWSVVDSDHIKPHNLVRHSAAGWAIGVNKAHVAALQAQHLFDSANPVIPISVSGLDAKNEALSKAIADAKVVVDATADLDFPRLASMREGGPRHVSTFLTPSANSSVMLMEDIQRSARLRTLEAQYYRAMINEAWGESHLQGHRARLWTGAGCRDKSMVMPYSAVMAHSAILAEQVMINLQAPSATMKIWNRDSATGEVAVRSLPCAIERTTQLGDVLVSMDEGLVEKLRLIRQEKLPNETGGILMGYHDFNLNILVLVDACAAPLDSVATATSFKRGTQGVKALLESAFSRTAGIVQYVGEWHSHPPKVSAAPSGDDKVQIMNLAALLADDGLSALSLIVGDAGDLTLMLGSAR